jgi:hypothetical protein
VARRAAHHVAESVPFSVLFAPGLGIRPRRRQRAAKLLRDIAASLEMIPEGSHYWTAVKGGLAEVNLDGWRFEYCVDPEARCIVVVAARRMAESPHKGTVRRTAG